MSDCCQSTGSLQNQIIKLQEMIIQLQGQTDKFVTNFEKDGASDDGQYLITFSDSSTFPVDLSRLNEASVSYNDSTTTLIINGTPYSLLKADNGLSVGSDGKIELGNEVGGTSATLHSDRDIPMAGFDITKIASNGDKTIFYGDTGNLDIGGNEQSNNIGDSTKTNERYNTANIYNKETTNATSTDGYGIRHVRFVQSKNGVINTGDDAVVEYLYPQDSSGNNAAIHVSRGDGYVRNLDGTLNRNVNLIGNSDNGIYVLGDAGSWLSRTDYTQGSGWNLVPVSNSATDEILTIDTTTLQLKRNPGGLKNITVSGSTPLFTETGTQTDHNTNLIIANFTKQTKGIIIITATLSALNSTIPNPFTFSLGEWLTIDGSYVAYNNTNSKLEHSYFGQSTEKQITNQYSFDLPAGTHTFGLGYNFVLGLGTVGGEQTSIGDITYTILYV